MGGRFEGNEGILYNVNNVWKSKFAIYGIGYVNLWNTKQKTATVPRGTQNKIT